MILLPWAAVSAKYARKTSFQGPGWLYLTIIATGFLSATRSILIGAALIGLLYFLIKRRRMGTGFILRLCAVLLVALGILVSGFSRFGSNAFRRMEGTQIEQETRWREVELWWPQVKGDIALGQGLGSQFISNVVNNGNPLESALHVGILTFLMKGGILLFLCCAILPLVKAVGTILTPSLSETRRGAAASALMFIALSCISGGWYPLSLFAYGMAICGMMTESRMSSPQIARGSATDWPTRVPHPALQR
jgi:hypothetical protein